VRTGFGPEWIETYGVKVYVEVEVVEVEDVEESVEESVGGSVGNDVDVLRDCL